MYMNNQVYRALLRRERKRKKENYMYMYEKTYCEICISIHNLGARHIQILC